MSTAPLQCPKCKQWLRVAIQARRIEFVPPKGRHTGQLVIEFDDQTVAHICKEEM